jgi:DivIVA domain-containing protein
VYKPGERKMRNTSATDFRQTRWRQGYNPTEVDAFVARVESALTSPTPSVRAEDIAQSRFTEVWLRNGYDVADVDAYLEKAQERLSRRGRE